MTTEVTTPIALLTALAKQSRGYTETDSQPVTTQSWRGFTFSICGLNIVFPFKGGFEILPGREVQTMPWAKDWLYGITNVRGDVYTVVDFARYLGFDGVQSLRTATFFLLPDPGLASTLLIDGRVSLRSFSEYLEHGSIDIAPERLQPCVNVVLHDNDQNWIVVDVDALSRFPDFIQVEQTSAVIGSAA